MAFFLTATTLFFRYQALAGAREKLPGQQCRPLVPFLASQLYRVTSK